MSDSVFILSCSIGKLKFFEIFMVAIKIDGGDTSTEQYWLLFSRCASISCTDDRHRLTD